MTKTKKKTPIRACQATKYHRIIKASITPRIANEALKA